MLAAGAGCLGLMGEPASDCRTGPGEFFLVVTQNKDYYGDPESYAKDVFHTVSYDGHFFGLMTTPQVGTGRILGPDDAFTNVTRQLVLGQLQATGAWANDTDYVVDIAWRAQLSPERFSGLCRVIMEEGDPDYPSGGGRVGCFDGGTSEFRVSTETASWTRTVGCLSDASDEEYELEARASIGL
jgi:hypothetical protein